MGFFAIFIQKIFGLCFWQVCFLGFGLVLVGWFVWLGVGRGVFCLVCFLLLFCLFFLT